MRHFDNAIELSNVKQLFLRGKIQNIFLGQISEKHGSVPPWKRDGSVSGFLREPEFESALSKEF